MAIEEWLSSPYVAVSGFIAVAGTILGLWQLLSELPSVLAIVAGVIVLAVLVLPGLVAFAFFSFHRLYHLPLTHRHINIDLKQRWHICSDGHREVELTRTMLFLAAPREQDLTDTVFGSLALGLDQVEYASADAKVVDGEQVSEEICRLYWEPKIGRIKIGRPYTHTFKCKAPAGPNAYNKSITIAAAVETVGCQLEISADNAIAEAVAFRRSRFQEFRSFDKIYRESKKAKRRNSPAIVRVSDRSMNWEIERLRPGHVHYIVLRLSEHSGQDGGPKSAAVDAV